MRCRCAIAPLACRAQQQATQLATALGMKAWERKEQFDSAPPRQTKKPKTARGASRYLKKHFTKTGALPTKVKTLPPTTYSRRAVATTCFCTSGYKDVLYRRPGETSTWIARPMRTYRGEASRGFEPRSLDSESRVLTVTPRGRLAARRPRH